MSEKHEATLRVIGNIGRIDAAAWDRCAGDDNPFLSHAFLSALEDSKSAVTGTGWHPQHLALEDTDKKLIGAVPLYLKNHSYGEYVFDHAWADAYRRVGGDYYPKLQCCVPFTPVPGPRLLLAPEAPPACEDQLIAALPELARQTGVSSLHITFPEAGQWERLGAAHFLKRVGMQFHWENKGYRTFDDFLGDLASRKRKQIKKERREALSDGITIRMLRGADIKTTDWDAFYRFYQSTVDKKWGSAYLTRAFFTMIGERMGDRILLIIADQGGRPIAGALNFIGKHTLYGRNWGALGDYKFLHFEVCYYRAIDFAIAEGLSRVEAGAQGTHKIQRGYLPALTYSAHWFRDANLAEAVAKYLDKERLAIEEQMTELDEFSPMRQENGQAENDRPQLGQDS